VRVEHDYERQGALQYLAAWDVHRAQIFSRCVPKTGIAPFGAPIDDVMATEPYCSAKRVFWIVDNGSSHRGNTAVEREQARHPRLSLIHCPIHSSWLNQVEIYLSIVDRKVLTPNDFPNLMEVERRLNDFERRFEVLAKLLRRLKVSSAAA
jgi:hypothetical protein